jgi:transcriptional regulator with XRE-family HTH domain
MAGSEEAKIASVTSICVILLRDVRTERNLHQAQIADWIGKTPSAWTKVEAGKSPLQFETFIRVCNSMQVAPSSVLATAERYAALLSQHGWAILTSEAAFEEDQLIRQAQQYWASPGGRSQAAARLGFWSVLNGPTYNLDGTVSIAPVFQFALDSEFRKLQLAPPLATYVFEPLPDTYST